MIFFVASKKFKEKYECGASLGSVNNIFTTQDFLVGTSHEFRETNGRFVAFSGTRLTEHSLISHWNFESASNKDIESHYINRNSDYSLGTFGLLTWNDKEWEVTLDRLAQYTLFIWRKENEYIISNSIETIVSLLKVNNISVKKSVPDSIITLLHGTAFGGSTGYENINIVRSNSISSESLSREKKAEKFLFLKDVYSSELTYEELLEKTKNFIKSAAKNINKETIGGRVLSDLTGGADSRLTFSILQNSKLSYKDIEVFCLGSDASADKIVADYLVEKYALSPGTFYYAKSPEGTSPADAIEKGVHRFHGMKVADFGDFGDGRVNGQTKITGYYGELSRIFYDFPESNNEELIKNFISKDGLDKYFNPDIIEAFKSKLRDFLIEVDRVGLGFQDKCNAIYLLNRNKIHIGMSAYLTESRRQAFHPLCSSLFTKLSSLLPKERRKMNQVAFDLIKGLSGDLVTEPMAEKIWHKDLFSESFRYEDYKKECLIRNGESKISQTRYKYAQKNLLHASQEKHLVNKDFSKKMRNSGVQLHWALLPDVVNRLTLYMDKNSDSSEISNEFHHSIKIDKIKRLIGGIEFNTDTHRKTNLTNPEAKFLLKLLSVYSWTFNNMNTSSIDLNFDLEKFLA